MKTKKFDVEAYRNQVQEDFSGVDGWDNFSQGDEAMNFSQDEEAYMATEVEEPEAPELNFTIVNAATTNGEAVFFGSSINLDPAVANFGSSAGVTITPDYNIGYSRILRDSAVAPFTIGKVRVQCDSNAAQVTQGLTVVSSNIYGDGQFSPINMITTVNQYQFNPNITESGRAFDITPDVFFKFVVLPSTTLRVTLYIKRKVNVARQLVERPIAGNYSAPVGGISPVMVGRGGQLKKLTGA